MHLKSRVKMAPSLREISLEACGPAKPFQQVSEAQALFGAGIRRKCSDMLNGQPVVAFGFGIGGQGIGAVTSQFCIVSDLWRFRSTVCQVADAAGGSLLLASLGGMAQDFCGAPVQAGAPARGEAVVEMAD